MLVPDAPINLIDDIEVTSSSVIKFSWTAASNGGTTIIDYTILYDESVDKAGTVLKTGHIGTTYTSTATDFTVVSGRTYKFQVIARNSVGPSAASAVLTILAAQKPEAPTNLVTSIDGSNVKIKWSSADDGSTSIFGYLIQIKQHDGTFSESTSCNGLLP